jgi:acyl dehydratase
MQKYSISELEEGQEFDLGATVLSQQDIIEFAKAFDPLDFHTDPEAAKKSMFGGIIASGPHIFTYVHRTQWIPRFGHTVIAGLEVTNWKFLKPTYPDKAIHSKVTITRIKPNPVKGYAAVTWFYEFRDEDNELMQTLEMTVLHKLK